MEIKGCNVELFSVKDNIQRCVITKKKEVKNNSVMIGPEIFAQMKNCSSEMVTQNGNELQFLSESGAVLLRIVDFSLEAIEVMQYTTDGEKPQIEVLKTVDGERTLIKNLRSYVDRIAFRGELNFVLDKHEGIYGLGQDEEGVYNRRGTICYLYQHNMRIPMPCIVSDKGYGILFDCPSLMVFDDSGDLTKISFDTVDQIDFYVIIGSMDEIVSGFRALTGKATMLPKWAFGYIQSKETYSTGDELIEVAQKYRDLNIPLDCVVQDWKTWQGTAWGQKTVDKARYPNLKKTIDELHKMNVHSMVSVWPNMAEGCEDHAEMEEQGYLLGDYSTYDAFSEEARDLYWQQAERELFSSGFDAWWCDSTEPFASPDWGGQVLLPAKKRYELVGEEHKKYLDPAMANFYAVMHAKGIYENQRKSNPEKRVMNLTRSGYPGIQQYGAILWAGDTSARWETLRGEIAKGLNMSMSGIPYWTVDIGAFFVGGTKCWRIWKDDPDADPVWFWNGAYDEGMQSMAYRELYTRWLQFATFLPVFRSHGTDTPREIWRFGKEGEMFYDAIAKFIKLRYHLLPTIYSLAARVALEDYTIMRSLLFDFAEDEELRQIDDQFMFGDSLLVCPITEAMYYREDGSEIDTLKERKCYLPKTTQWYDYWSGQLYQGGQHVIASAPIDTIPIFVRTGSILLTQKDVQYASENDSEFDVRIYPGADARFCFYNDDGESYHYEKGQYESIEFIWSDDEKTLLIREKSKLRNAPIQFKIHYEGLEKLISFNGKEEKISF